MEKLINIIKEFKPLCEQEIVDKISMLQFIDAFKELSLDRSCLIGHFTVSAIVINKEKTHVLMAYHNIYKSMSWLGGHLDGARNYEEKTREEIEEETGVNKLELINDGIISLEILPVFNHTKKGKYIPHHEHLNISFAYYGDMSQELVINKEENSAVKWIKIEEIDKEVNEELMKEIYHKIINRILKDNKLDK